MKPGKPGARRTAREFMRRGYEPDDAAWCERVDDFWALRLVRWGAGAARRSGMQRRARMAALRAGLAVVRVHRWLWVQGALR